MHFFCLHMTLQIINDTWPSKQGKKYYIHDACAIANIIHFVTSSRASM